MQHEDSAGTHIPANAEAPANSASPAAELEVHESALIFPPMRDAEFEALVEDIRVNGQREPIVMHQGKIIDGRHRYRACKKLGIAPITREWDGHGSLLDFVVSANLHRRHLKENQRAMVAARLLPLYEAEALARKKSGGVVDFNQGTNSSPVGKSKHLAGDLFCVSGTSVSLAKRILNFGIPDLIARVDQGDLAVSVAAKIAEFPSAEQKRLLALSHSELLKTLRPDKPGNPSKPSIDPQQAQRDEKLMKIFSTTTVALKKTESGQLCLELSMANWFHELKSFANNPCFPDLLDRGVIIARR